MYQIFLFIHGTSSLNALSQTNCPYIIHPLQTKLNMAIFSAKMKQIQHFQTNFFLENFQENLYKQQSNNSFTQEIRTKGIAMDHKMEEDASLYVGKNEACN
jgi:hypothetical protein